VRRKEGRAGARRARGREGGGGRYLYQHHPRERLVAGAAAKQKIRRAVRRGAHASEASSWRAEAGGRAARGEASCSCVVASSRVVIRD
jgi:hypothetical protein